ncbi:hypothetical protein ACFLTH_00925 [Bacteroidota bacterium]
MMDLPKSLKVFSKFSLKVVIAHTVTYFVFGLLMSNLFNYKEIFQYDVIKNFMHSIESPNILYGPFFQPIRGFLFAIAIWPLRSIIFEKKNGWLILWGLFVVFGILSPPSAAPGSIEGVIYTKLPLWYHLLGLPEIMLQTLVFSLLLVWWVKKSNEVKETAPMTKQRKIIIRLTFALMIACFGYIGFAIGGILSAKIAGVTIKVSSESISLKGQLIFVMAFFVNVISILALTSRRYFGKFSYFWFFLIFWGIDTISILLFQSLLGRMMPIHFGLIIGFFPALIIVLSYKINYKNYARLNESELDN